MNGVTIPHLVVPLWRYMNRPLPLRLVLLRRYMNRPLQGKSDILHPLCFT